MRRHILRLILLIGIVVALALVLGVLLRPFSSVGLAGVDAYVVGSPSVITATVATPVPGVKWSSYAAQITPAANAMEAEALPAYPNAEDISTNKSNFLNQPDKIRFYTSDPLGDVGEFYSAVLPKAGWVDEDGWTDLDNGTIAKAFLWPDNPDDLYRLTVSILIRNQCLRDASNANTDQTNLIKKRCVEVELFRRPFASRVPMYAGAYDVQVEEQPVATRPPFNTRTTQYTINVSPQEVEDFYRTTLGDNGWAVDLETIGTPPSGVTNGIVFTDPTTPIIETMQPRVVVSATAIDNKQTQVQIIANGPELRTSSP